MKATSWIRAAVLFVAALAATSGLDAVQASAKPKIVFDHESWDFGRVKQAEKLEVEFVFKNDGRGTLNIDKVETSCGCTAALVSEKRLEPGKTGRIKVAFDTAGYSGRVTKHVFVTSNDPDRGKVQLAVTADVETPPQPKFELAPYMAELGLLLEGEPLQTEVVIRNRGELELVVECDHKNAEFSSGGKPVVFPLKVPAGKDRKISLVVKPSGRAGVIREYVLFRSNDPTRQALSFGLSGFVATKEQVREFLERNKNRLK